MTVSPTAMPGTRDNPRSVWQVVFVVVPKKLPPLRLCKRELLHPLLRWPSWFECTEGGGGGRMER